MSHILSELYKHIFLTCVFVSKGAFSMCSFGLEWTEGFRLWGSPRVIQPSGAVWVSVESLPVFTFTAGMEGRVWTPAHLYSKLNSFGKNISFT